MYVDGRLHEAAKRVGDHMGSLPDKSPWASFMTFLGTNQLEIAPLIFPWPAVGAGDLAFSPRWTEWYGKDLDVRAATKLLSQKQYKFVQLQSETGATAEEMASSGADEQVVVTLK